MKHPIFRVTGFDFISEYKLRVTFDDGSTQYVDFEPILAGEIFGPLRDATLFKQVTIDPEIHTLVWPNGADFDPATLHDWPKHSAELQARAQSWTPSPT